MRNDGCSNVNMMEVTRKIYIRICMRHISYLKSSYPEAHDSWNAKWQVNWRKVVNWGEFDGIIISCIKKMKEKALSMNIEHPYNA